MKNTPIMNIMLIAFTLSTALSLAQLSLRTAQEQNPTSKHGLHTLSYQFEPIKPIFKDIPKAGYITDKNIEHPLALAQYQLAQFVLAPTILEINNANLPLSIVDCTTPQAAIEKVNSLELAPITASPTGYVVAANPRVKP